MVARWPASSGAFQAAWATTKEALVRFAAPNPIAPI
jgi:hypothetical protein